MTDKKALLIPSPDRYTRARLPHMLPAVAHYIRKNYKAMDERLQRFVNLSSFKEVTSRSPAKAAVKDKLAATEEELASKVAENEELRGENSSLKATVASLEQAKVR
jgi:hypothetical protein